MLVSKQLYERIIRKKKALDRLRPLPKAALEKLQTQLDIELTYNSNAIEGNTLTLQETKLVIERGITVKGKPLKHHLEATNHKSALDKLKEFVKKKKPVTEEIIGSVHKILFAGIADEEAGRYRKVNVRILGAIKTPPQYPKVPALMKSFVEYAQTNPENLNPLEFAAKLHHRFVEIHPFFDGNGRIARILMNLILMQHGFPITIIQNADRKKYYDCLKAADKGNLEPFANFVSRAVERSLDLYISSFEAGLEYVPLKEAAKHSPYTQEYLSLQARKGVLAAIKIGRNWFTTRQALTEYVKEHGRKQVSDKG